MARQYALNDDRAVVVIGSGAGGGTLSNELAQKGIDVICLEAGPRLTLNDVVNDPVVMNERMGWNDPRIGPPLFNARRWAATPCAGRRSHRGFRSMNSAPARPTA